MTKSARYSKTSSMYLQLLLRSVVAGSIIAGILSAIQWVAPEFYFSYLEIGDALFGIFVLLLVITAVIVSFRWIYVVHKDLHVMDKDYSISPGGALARFMIPIYNFWGIWNVLSTMHKYFEQKKGGSKKVYGLNLDRLTNMIYIAWIISMVVTRLLLSNMNFENPENTVDPSLFILSAVSDAFFYGTALLVVMTVGRNLGQKVNLRSRS